MCTRPSQDPLCGIARYRTRMKIIATSAMSARGTQSTSEEVSQPMFITIAPNMESRWWERGSARFA